MFRAILVHLQLQWKSPDTTFIYLHTQLIYLTAWYSQEMLVCRVAPQQGIFVFLLNTHSHSGQEDALVLLCEPAELW